MSPLPDQTRPGGSPTSGTPAFPPQPAIQGPVHVVLEKSNWSRWSNRLAWIGLAICVLVIISLTSNYRSYFQTNPDINEKYHSLSKTAMDKVAIITVEGAILHDEGFVKWQIDRVREDDSVKAIVLRVDSPGGTVTGSDYIYHHLKKLMEDKEIPLVVSMGGMAASGGYYVSMAVGDTPNTIFAEPTTWTGSIGVIIPHYDLSKLLAEYNVKDDSFSSHPYKQMLSPTREMPEQERAVVQQLVDLSFADFKAIVKSGRPNISDAKLTEIATGQIFTAKQALDHGLVDKIGFIEEAIDRSIELGGLDKESVRVVKYTRPPGLFDSVLGGNVASTGSRPSLAGLLELTAPRAYYLCTWLPAAVASGR